MQIEGLKINSLETKEQLPLLCPVSVTGAKQPSPDIKTQSQGHCAQEYRTEAPAL